MSITPAKLHDIRTDMNAALRAVAEKHGLRQLSAGKATYSDDNFSFKVEGVVLGGLTPEAERYVRYQSAMRLPPLNTVVTFSREQYRTTGLNTTGSKVMATRVSNGKNYLLPIESVQARDTAFA